MIGSLRGEVVDRRVRGDHALEVVVDVAGVGYRVTVPAGAAVSGQVQLLVHTHVREDAIVLYGFPDRDQRDCFEALIAAHGVGPAVALAMLSVHSPAALRKAVATDDVDALTLVPGVGRKTAARLLVELKGRLGDDLDLGPVGVPGAAPADARAEVRAALAGLGYGADEVRAAVAALPTAGTVEDLLRQALRDLAAAR